MGPGLEKWFEGETAELNDKSVPYSCSPMAGSNQKDGSIASPIDPEEVKDAKEYIERLKQIKINI
jgi:hypothetical protein